MAKIAFVGLGIMGKPMSKNLLKAGHSVVVFDVAPAPVADVRPDQLAEMADGQGHPAEAGPGELAEHDFHDRVLLADRHEGLGKSRRVGPQPDALAPGENDRVHAASVVHWLYSSGL